MVIEVYIVDEFWLRSEEHTSELQSLTNLVCRLLLEKKKHFRRFSLKKIIFQRRKNLINVYSKAKEEIFVERPRTCLLSNSMVTLIKEATFILLALFFIN